MAARGSIGRRAFLHLSGRPGGNNIIINRSSGCHLRPSSAMTFSSKIQVSASNASLMTWGERARRGRLKRFSLPRLSARYGNPVSRRRPRFDVRGCFTGIAARGTVPQPHAVLPSPYAPSVQMALGQKTLCNEHCSSEQLKLVRTALPGLSNPVVSRGELSCLEAMTGSGRQRCSRPLTKGPVRVRCGRVEGSCGALSRKARVWWDGSKKGTDWEHYHGGLVVPLRSW